MKSGLVTESSSTGGLSSFHIAHDEFAKMSWVLMDLMQRIAEDAVATSVENSNKMASQVWSGRVGPIRPWRRAVLVIKLIKKVFPLSAEFYTSYYAGSTQVSS